MHPAKITVVKRIVVEDVIEEHMGDACKDRETFVCQQFQDGQEFVVDGESFWKMMHGGFCAEAWDSISRYVYAALQGGSIMRGWTNRENVMIACCNDGTRPVIFKLERMDEDE